MGRHCTSSDVDWTSPCWDRPSCVCVALVQPHTAQPVHCQGTSSTCPVQKAGSPTRTELFCFYVLDLFIIITLLAHVSSLSQAVRICVPMYYIMVFVKVTFVAMETSSASSFQLPTVLVDSTVELRFRVVWADASGVLVSFWQMTGVSSLCATYMFANIEWSYKTKVVV